MEGPIVSGRHRRYGGAEAGRVSVEVRWKVRTSTSRSDTRHEITAVLNFTFYCRSAGDRAYCVRSIVILYLARRSSIGSRCRPRCTDRQQPLTRAPLSYPAPRRFDRVCFTLSAVRFLSLHETHRCVYAARDVNGPKGANVVFDRETMRFINRELIYFTT